jgi:CHASE3 domain sensor protein
MAWTFGRKLGLSFALTVIALVVVGVVGMRATQSLIEHDAQVGHTQLVRTKIAAVLRDMVDAETGQRGFVITGRDEFLEPYTAAVAAVDRDYSDLRRQIADDPTLVQQLDEAKPNIDGKLAELKQVIGERRTSIEAAQATIAAGVGKQQMDAVRRILGEMDDETVHVLDAREQHAAETASQATDVILWGSIGTVVLTILIGWFITSSLTKQIGGTVRNLQSSAAELQAAANQQASGMTEQATAMTEVATTINELLATSRQIADSSQRVSHIAGETATVARQGNATVGKSNDAVGLVRRQVDLIVSHMGELGRKAQQVGSVLDIVQELAEQTNILAINATIEAAGAGEAGRRFGVVADEIRKLADRVGSSTKEIRTMIEDVRSAVTSTVMVTEAGSKAVDAGAAQSLEMATAFTHIASLVVTTMDAAREIELSTKQQATAVAQVNDAITSVTQTTRESETSTTQTLQTSQQLSALSLELSRMVAAS